MKKIAFYGLGEQFERNIVQNNFVCGKLKKNIIAGFIDQNKAGSHIKLNDICYTVLSLDKWTDYSVDQVVISSVKYQDEIREKLIEHGFKEDQVGTLDQFVFGLFDHIDLIERCIRGKGIEIGGPSVVFSHVYDVCKECDGVNFNSDTVWWKGNGLDRYIVGNRVLGKMFITDATDLAEIRDEAYDFVLSSNNLEHIANPIKSVGEFYRVTKRGGIIIVVVPRKFVNFDHNRQFTSFEHILTDYRNHITEDDLSHLPEIVEKHDYDMDPACGGKENFLHRASKNYENRCLHHHVFDKRCLMELFGFFELQILDFAECYSDYWIIGRR